MHLKTHTRRTFVGLLFAMSIYGLFGCGGQAMPSPSPTSTAEPAPSPTPTSVPVDPAELLTEASERMATAGSYRLVMDLAFGIEAEGLTMEVPAEMMGEFVYPDRSRTRTEISFLGETQEQEVITVGGTVYQRDPGTGEWQITESDPAEVPVDPSEEFVTDVLTTADSLTVVDGEAPLDGAATVLLSATVPASTVLDDDTGQGELALRVWIGKEDPYMYRMELTGELSAEEFAMFGEVPADARMSISMDIHFSDFGAPISIEPPPVD